MTTLKGYKTQVYESNYYLLTSTHYIVPKFNRTSYTPKMYSQKIHHTLHMNTKPKT